MFWPFSPQYSLGFHVFCCRLSHLGPELSPACVSSLKSMGPTPHTHPLSCSSSTLYSPKPNHAATRPFPVWGPVSGTEEACLSFGGAHTIRLLAFSSPQCGMTGISKPGCCSPRFPSPAQGLPLVLSHRLHCLALPSRFPLPHKQPSSIEFTPASPQFHPKPPLQE